MTTTIAHPKAVAGRRVTFTYFRDLDVADGPEYPGIVTGTETAANGILLARIRLDGTRSNLAIPADYEGLTYLDEVVPVPELPMGRFLPVADDRNGFYERRASSSPRSVRTGKTWSSSPATATRLRLPQSRTCVSSVSWRTTSTLRTRRSI
ncbi:hypothetical protein ACFQ0G_53835 [Streptomyces chiangmaiensis]